MDKQTPSSSPARDGDFAVEHDAAGSRFVARVDGAESVAAYEMAGRTMRMTHTEVPPAQRDRGIAAALVRAAIGHARSEGLEIEPVCPYVLDYMDSHPDSSDVRAA